MPLPDDLRGRLSAAHAEALRIGDSTVRADQLEAKLRPLLEAVRAADADEDLRSRLGAALESAIRVLRRDEDGREAAKHLSTATGLLEPRPRKPSPFLDD